MNLEESQKNRGTPSKYKVLIEKLCLSSDISPPPRVQDGGLLIAIFLSGKKAKSACLMSNI